MNKTIKTIPLYRVKCRFLASTLYSLGFVLEDTERENGVCYFCFQDGDKCKEVVKKYFSAGELKVEPRILFSAFTDIKNILYNN
jgi:hypothetical protein